MYYYHSMEKSFLFYFILEAIYDLYIYTCISQLIVALVARCKDILFNELFIEKVILFFFVFFFLIMTVFMDQINVYHNYGDNIHIIMVVMFANFIVVLKIYQGLPLLTNQSTVYFITVFYLTFNLQILIFCVTCFIIKDHMKNVSNLQCCSTTKLYIFFF